MQMKLRLRLEQEPRNELKTGDVGYIISGIKTSSEVKVGDTITHVERPCAPPSRDSRK